MTMTGKQLEAFDPTKAKAEFQRAFIRLPRPVKEEAERRAKARRLTLNKYVSHALIVFMKGERK